MKDTPIHDYNIAAQRFAAVARTKAETLRLMADNMDDAAKMAETVGANDFTPDTVVQLERRAVLGEAIRNENRSQAAEAAVRSGLADIADAEERKTSTFTVAPEDVMPLPPAPQLRAREDIGDMPEIPAFIGRKTA